MSTPRRDRFIAGDPLRAIAALGVFGVHTRDMAFTASGNNHLLFVHFFTGNPSWTKMFGLIGVPLAALSYALPLFFVLSGYLITRPFVHSFVMGRPRPGVLRFVRNRVLRIIPAFWVVFTILIVISGTGGQSLSRFVSSYDLSTVTVPGPFLTVFGQVWTLHIEAMFYIAVTLAALGLMLLGALRPSVIAKHLSPPTRAALIVLAGCVLTVVTMIQNRHSFWSSPFSLGGQAFCFAPGVMLAAIEPLVIERATNSKLARRIGALITMVAFTSLLLSGVVIGRLQLHPGVPANMWGRVYICLMEAGLLGGPLLYQWATGNCWWFLDNRFLRWMGSRSYSFYLWHKAVLWEVVVLVGNVGGYKRELLVLLPSVFLGTAVLAEITYRLVELPCMQWRRNGATRKHLVVPGAAAEALSTTGG